MAVLEAVDQQLVPLDAVERAKKERLGAGPSRGGAGASVAPSSSAPRRRQIMDVTDVSSDEADARAAGGHELDDDGEGISASELYSTPDFGAASGGSGDGERDDNQDFDDINEDLFGDDDGGGSGDYEDGGQFDDDM